MSRFLPASLFLPIWKHLARLSCLVALCLWVSASLTGVHSKSAPPPRRLTTILANFNSPTISQGTTSVQIIVTLTIGPANNERPNSVQLVIPLNPTVFNLNGSFTIAGGPGIPGPPDYQAQDLTVSRIPGQNGVLVQLIPLNINSARINSGTNVFCTITAPVLANAPGGSYPLNFGSLGGQETAFTQTLEDGFNDIPFSSTAGTLTVTGGGGGCPTVNVAPASLPNGMVGTAYNQTITASGGNGGPFTFAVTSGALPGGLTLAANGGLSGTPTASGGFNFTVTATGAGGCTGNQNYNVTISGSGCPAVTVNPATLPGGTVGTAYNQTLSATGGNGGPFSFAVTSGTLPAGLSLPTTGNLSGTPTSTGTSNFTVTATGANGCTGTRSYSLTITAGNCPVITVSPATLPNGSSGTSYTQTITASGGTAPYTFTVSSGSLPSGLTLSTSGVLAGTPTSGGAFNFTIQATDANNCTGSNSYTITIAGGCNQLTISPAALPSATLGTSYSQTLTATGAVGAVSFSLASGALPQGLSLSVSGVLSGVPTVAGTANFSINVTDSRGCAGTQSFTLVVGSSIDTQPPTVKLTAPVGGEELKAGSQFVITWTSQDNRAVVKQDIALSTDGGQTFPLAVAGGLFGNAQRFVWTVPQLGSTQARIRVTAFDSDGNRGNDISPANFTINPPPPPDFSISIAPAMQRLPLGGSVAFQVLVLGQNGFNEDVVLEAAADVEGLDFFFPTNPAPVGNFVPLEVKTTDATDTILYSITVTATSSTLVRTQTVTLEVFSAGDFALQVNPTAQTVVAGGSAAFTVGMQSLNGFDQPAQLSFITPNNRISGSFSLNRINPTLTSTLTIEVAPDAPAETVSVAVQAVAGDLTRTIPLELQVVRSGFALVAEPGQVAVSRGQKTALGIRVLRTGGFSGDIMVAAPNRDVLKKLQLKISPANQLAIGSPLIFNVSVKAKAQTGVIRLTFVGNDATGKTSSADVVLTVQ
ncbi:MAG: Ig domain-containing protein [Blastocatellia bacterium]|nr:Ig domain-containing protein [Blastocatellia bacterium]